MLKIFSAPLALSFIAALSTPSWANSLPAQNTYEQMIEIQKFYSGIPAYQECFNTKIQLLVSTHLKRGTNLTPDEYYRSALNCAPKNARVHMAHNN